MVYITAFLISLFKQLFCKNRCSKKLKKQNRIPETYVKNSICQEEILYIIHNTDTRINIAIRTNQIYNNINNIFQVLVTSKGYKVTNNNNKNEAKE